MEIDDASRDGVVHVLVALVNKNEEQVESGNEKAIVKISSVAIISWRKTQKTLCKHNDLHVFSSCFASGRNAKWQKWPKKLHINEIHFSPQSTLEAKDRDIRPAVGKSNFRLQVAEHKAILLHKQSQKPQYLDMMGAVIWMFCFSGLVLSYLCVMEIFVDKNNNNDDNSEWLITSRRLGLLRPGWKCGR